MVYKRLPDNFDDILRSYGLKVVEIPGWRDRGRPALTGAFNPVGVLNHHTGAYDGMGDAANDYAYAKWMAVDGRSDLPAPLCQLSVSAEGVVYLCASGRANHAGRAKASGSMAAGDGNELYIGIEAMNSGTQGFGKPQRDALVLLNAIINLRVTGNSSRTNRAHKETSTTGKWDPGKLNMTTFRASVAAKMLALKVSPRWKWNPDQKSDLGPVQEQFQIVAGAKKGKVKRYHGVAHIQNALNVKNGEHLTVNGICDKATVAAWRRWEAKNSGTGRTTTPDEVSLQKLQILYRFRVPAKPAPQPKPEPKPEPPAVRFSVMDWNVENKGAADAVADRAEIIKLVTAEKPEYVALQEVYRVDLDNIPGYQTYHPTKGYTVNSEHRAQALLVRNDVDIKVREAIPMEEEWTGPKMGVAKEPRIHRRVTGNKSDTNLPVATFHVPFGKDSVEETRLAAIALLKEMEEAHGCGVIVGDWNSLADELQAKVGTPAGAKVDGGGLDKAVFVGLKKVKGENLGKRGRSDHPVKIWTFEA